MDAFSKLQEIFRDIFDDETLELTRKTMGDDIEDWDSLAQVNIIAACEAEFRIKFEIIEIVSIKNVGDIIDLVERKMA